MAVTNHLLNCRRRCSDVATSRKTSMVLRVVPDDVDQAPGGHLSASPSTVAAAAADGENVDVDDDDDDGGGDDDFVWLY